MPHSRIEPFSDERQLKLRGSIIIVVHHIFISPAVMVRQRTKQEMQSMFFTILAPKNEGVKYTFGW